MTILSFPGRWILETKTTGYSFGLNENGVLVHSYWGPRLLAPDDYPTVSLPAQWGPDSPAHQTLEEYPVYGGLKFSDPCLKVTFADGVRDVVPKFRGAEIRDGRNSELVIRLSDEYYPLEIDLHYRLQEAHDLIERWVTLKNHSEKAISIERIFSAQWHFPQGGEYFLTHLYGRWLDEFHIQRDLLSPGIKVLESRRIITSHNHNPWFSVDDGSTDEENGRVWFGVLCWSGNWKLAAEVTETFSTRINLGLNDWDFAWQLKPGEEFITPASLAGFTQNGSGAAKRRLHDYIRDEVLPHGHQLHKVLYNSWEATQFNVNEKSQIELAEIAARIEVELFVMDDGWFQGRDSDNAGLGDWYPSRTKFPNGLGKLIKRVNDLGMDFGLWIEPEMVNPDSDLYRAHPDWVIHFPTRARTESRNQLILNFARDDVCNYIIDAISKLLGENNIRFIKWDMNRHISEPGWQDAPGNPRELWVRYVYGLYQVWGELRKRFPEVIWQSCSSGGGRVDLGILHFADQAWVSDNTEAAARLTIQEGYSCVFPANTMEAWVTDANQESIPLEFRFHASMTGCLGVGANLVRWSEDEIKTASKWIEFYKTIRPIIQLGDQYRLRSTQKSGYSSVQYMDKEKAEGVLFVFRIQSLEPVELPRIYLRGLDSARYYIIDDEGEPKTGEAWMDVGLRIQLGNFQSVIKRIMKVEMP